MSPFYPQPQQGKYQADQSAEVAGVVDVADLNKSNGVNDIAVH